MSVPKGTTCRARRLLLAISPVRAPRHLSTYVVGPRAYGSAYGRYMPMLSHLNQL